jgi:hypothetical protein
MSLAEKELATMIVLLGIQAISSNASSASVEPIQQHASLEKGGSFLGGEITSRFYQGIFADVLNTRRIITNIDQDATVPGASTPAAMGPGLRPVFDKIDRIHKTVVVIESDNKIIKLSKRCYQYFLNRLPGKDL